MKLSVILATYDRDSILEKTLQSLIHLHLPKPEWEIIVVDNACQTSTKELVDSYLSLLPIKYLQESKPGKNNAIMTGLNTAQSDLLVFTDDDIIADENWLTAIAKGAENYPDFDLFGGKITPHFPMSIQLDPLIDRQHPMSKIAFVDLDLGSEDIPISADQIWGPNMAVRRRVFDAGQTFNPSIGPSQNPKYTMGSETSLLLPAERAGFKAMYLAEAKVLHQIRPEQMSLRWMKGRALRMGKGKAANSPEVSKMPFMMGIPRYLHRKILSLFIKMTTARILGQRAKEFDLLMSYWSCRGMAEYYRENNEKS